VRPVLGAIVHYFDVDEDRAYAAIIICTVSEGIGFHSPTHVDLRLLVGGGDEDEDLENVPFSEVLCDGCWSWPAKSSA
jgi:hypothetical protein